MEIKDIKAQLSIHQVLDHYGIKVNQNRHCLCPFHDDKNPSMQVYPETNTVHCFSGNCEHTGKAIDQIDFILHKENCTKHEAITKAKKLIGINIIEEVNQKHQPSQEDLTTLFKTLQTALTKSKKAQEYLASRNLTPTKDIGYNHYKTNYKHLQNCLIFPLKDQTGQITSLYGRSLTTGHYYSANRTGLYPNYPAGSTRRLLLTESVIDAATLKQHLSAEAGAEYEVLALYGTNGLTAEHIEAIKTLKDLQEITLFLDADEAGRKATEKYAQQLKSTFKVKVSQVDCPDGEDPNSLTISHDPEILTHLIENRIPFSTDPPQEKRQAESVQRKALDTTNQDYLVYTQSPLQISILGGINLHPIDKMRVTLKIERTDSSSPLHQIRHSLDLYHDDQVEKLNRKVSERLELGSREIQAAMSQLINDLEQYRLNTLEEQKPKQPQTRTLPANRTQQALQILQQKNYLTQTLPELLAQTGVVGEKNNSLILWITYATRKQPDPLHVICLGASGTGKTFLQEKITDLIPDEDKVSGTAISENALYYAQDLNLKNKLFIIEDLDGASNILYALRELQTKKEISKMVTQKDSKGNLKTEIVTVHGPISLTATTTKERLYEDNANRCLLLYLDNSKQQQESIMDDQRKKSAGKHNKKEREATKELLRDLQTLYEPITIRNPYAEQLKIPDTVFKPLRTNSHYLAFIEGITYCNQFQRKKHRDPTTQETYINTEIEDIALANELMKEVLLSKSDELTKACRSFYENLKTHLAQANKPSFYKSEIRTYMRINPNNLKYYLKQLSQYGYIRAIGGNRYKQGTEYEISDLEEYQKLHKSLKTSLDQALHQIKTTG